MKTSRIVALASLVTITALAIGAVINSRQTVSEVTVVPEAAEPVVTDSTMLEPVIVTAQR